MVESLRIAWFPHVERNVVAAVTILTQDGVSPNELKGGIGLGKYLLMVYPIP